MTEAALPLTDAAVRADQRLWARYLRRPLGVAALAVFLLVVLVGLLAPLLAPHDPNLVDYNLTQAPPGGDHLMGGDSAGRDIFSRLLYGARTTVYGAAVACLVGVGLGVPTGIAAGYFGGLADRISSWISDGLQSVPGMIVLLIVAAGTGADFTVLMVTVGAFMAPGYYRISRSKALAVRREPYVDAARVAGLTHGRILRAHMLRAVRAPVIIQTALTAGVAMGMQTGLQFLGVGTGSTPDWGQMMNDGFRTMGTHPLILLWPSVALGVTIAALAFMGSTLADLVSARTAPAPRRRGKETDRRTEATTAASGELTHPAEVSALRIDNLRVGYRTPQGDKQVVRGVSLDVAPGEVLGIVGESGSGKSQTMFSALDLLPDEGSAAADGIWIGGESVAGLSRARRHALLGTRVGYVPQEPMSNLDPCYTIGHQLTEPLRAVHGLSKADARARAHEVLVRVGITDPERVMASYPHQVSGGMAQRVLIAGAVAGKPDLLVADEPTTALDVTVQAEVLELLRELQQEYGMALVIVTHNFGVVADICDRVAVMKDGRVIESGTVERIFAEPGDPYTAELIRASQDDTESRDDLDAAWHGARKVTA
ncbi:dipeptide/oligopeptide/nickel ABC transporter permease/ATP-binding protein [Streptomyces sp. OfavH-34-F]|uniref:dipeptide/oligopeptide/nickel ABC transporter permease/ATP-binding protein n=1 Tax=Streptomyces sp. OfavH-34-F TaxID=2917760 RepID=UPI001EF1CC5F|nr:dipeptide/oligopeptide/nickel ABC transporter permease/ATP-binding protein [Streptomyces sp. OfavH-34-F]MCG7529098.1 dipeptide/oligopeptide/nickel ABC transporter permease/ATP-binding protein [Streptomyces sp. OfavH-34-F]